jgi:very-short-patch-repair endonuclease
MLRYRPDLKARARDLRTDTTDSEQVLWARLRRKQLLDVQVYRQKPIGCYIVDFYAPKASLVIEVDGSQHLEESHAERDRERDAFLRGEGLTVLRFSSTEVLKDTDAVVEEIYRVMAALLKE